MAAKILIIGSAVDRNLIRLVNNIKKNDAFKELIIDVLDTNPPLHYKLKARLSELTIEIRKLYIVKDVKEKNPLLKNIKHFINLFNSINDIKNNEYDIINIHYMSGKYLPLMHLISKKGRNLMITPWGSDVYRVKGLNKWMIKQAYKQADYISFGSEKFRNDIQSVFDLPVSKFVELSFGSEMIDLVHENTELDKEDAKIKLNIGGRYVIVCGYNASAGQQHLRIIESLISIKKDLPENTILLFPMTYAKNDAYISMVKEALDKSSFKYISFDEFLNNDELLYLRKCADIFIHVQISDAFSATIQESLLCDTKIINGGWLKYDDLEKWGVPYIVVESLETLGEAVKKVVAGEQNIVIPKQLKQDILSRGYKSQAKKWINFYREKVDKDLIHKI